MAEFTEETAEQPNLSSCIAGCHKLRLIHPMRSVHRFFPIYPLHRLAVEVAVSSDRFANCQFIHRCIIKSFEIPNKSPALCYVEPRSGHEAQVELRPTPPLFALAVTVGSAQLPGQEHERCVP